MSNGKIKEYIEQALKKGFDEETIRNALRKGGYSDAEIDANFQRMRNQTQQEGAEEKRIEASEEEKHFVPKEFPAKKSYGKMIVLAVIAAALVLLMIFIVIPAFAEKTCTDAVCFADYANECKKVKMISTEDTATYELKSANCVFTKKVLNMSETEPAAIRELFMGKTMECSYNQSSFNPDWIDTLIGGIEDCSGPLKEAIYEVVIASS